MKPPWKRDSRLRSKPAEATQFARSREARYCLSELCDFFIDSNPSIRDADADWKRLTEGQKLLVKLTVFDAEVRNGGVEQFFWNHPDQVFEIHDVLAQVGASSVADDYSKVLDQLCESGESWLDLRARVKSNTNEDLELFLDSRELIDTDEFNSSYYGEWDGWGKQLAPGYGDHLARSAVEYLTANLSQFVKDA